MPEFVLYASGLIAIAWGAAHAPEAIRRLIAYALFFVTPVLTMAGLIGPLTGFDRASTAQAYFGLSFLTPFLALLLITDAARIRASPFTFLAVTVNPVYMECGPIPRSARLRLRIRWRVLWRRLRVVQGDMIIGAFFVSILAQAFSPFLLLKGSLQPFDVLFFGMTLEGYVYFNFAGYAMLAWSVLRILGVDAPRNFAMPFSAASVVEYWKRWHLSLSNVLRALFFKPGRPYLGVYGAATMTFVASALWHGMTLNFVLWGFFHAACWSLSRWLYTRQAANWLQITLLACSIVIGRILFAESDTEILMLKFAALLDLPAWGDCHAFDLMASLSMKKRLAFLSGIGLILTESWFSRRARHRHYPHLKTPLVSTLLLACVVFLGIFSEGGAIYGQR